MAMLVTYIRQTPSSEPTAWETDGRPSVAHLTRLLGMEVSADERDEAWKRFRAAKGQAT